METGNDNTHPLQMINIRPIDGGMITISLDVIGMMNSIDVGDGNMCYDVPTKADILAHVWIYNPLLIYLNIFLGCSLLSPSS